jgi:hypothetical protein
MSNVQIDSSCIHLSLAISDFEYQRFFRTLIIPTVLEKPEARELLIDP